jgi:hypothetical protein
VILPGLYFDTAVDDVLENNDRAILDGEMTVFVLGRTGEQRRSSNKQQTWTEKTENTTINSAIHD